MAWIESHQSVGTHPKTHKLAKRLGVSVPQAVGHLHCLWHWALEYAFDGDLTGYDFDDIAIGAMWDGDADDFVKALLEAKGRSGHGFLDQEGERLFLYGWIERTTHLRARRESAQKANHIRWHSGRNVTDPSCEWCVTPKGEREESDTIDPDTTPESDETQTESDRTPFGPQSESTEPDRTEPDRTEPDLNLETPTRPPDALAEFENFWDHYPKRNGKRVARGQAEAVWKRMKLPERRLALNAVDHYRQACDGEITIAKDAHRWLSQRAFKDWQTPADPPTNGHKPYANSDEWTDEERGVKT